MDLDPDEEDTEDARLDDKRERQWRMVFEDNGGGVGDHKSLLYANRWGVYMNKKKVLIEGGYYVEVTGYDGNKVLW